MKDKEPPQDLLDWMGVKNAPNWVGTRSFGRLIGTLLVVAVPALFVGSLIAAFVVLWHTVDLAINGEGGAINLGAGALITALLGAPFLIWSTVLKHQTVRYQKEGHITDRINKAVEQLGTEKTVDRIGRPVTIWTGKPTQLSVGLESKEKYLQEPRSRVMGSEWSQHYNEETDEVWEGRLYDVHTWPHERTIIQWQGDEIALDQKEEIGSLGDWQVFTETVPNIEVRIGAILSLERIAQDSTRYDKGRDHVRVMEILCAYVRENAPADKAPTFPFPQGCREDTLDDKRKSSLHWFSNQFTARADVQLALSVIGRRTPEQLAVERNHHSQDGTGYRLDLSRTNLRYADLQHCNFTNASFFRSQMQAAFCKGTDFSGANFVYCELTGVSAGNANFSSTKLESADLSHATLTDADLRDSQVSHTHFVRTNLRNAKLQFPLSAFPREENRAFFVDSSLQGALIRGDLLGVYFSLRTLRDETIPRDIYGAAFQECRIGGLRRIFGDINHESAIPAEWLGKTFGDASVILPEGMARPAHWPDWELDGQSFDTEYRKWRANPDAYTPPPQP